MKQSANGFIDYEKVNNSMLQKVVDNSVDRTPVWFGKYKQELLSTSQRIAFAGQRLDRDGYKGKKLFGDLLIGKRIERELFVTPIKNASDFGRRSFVE